MNRKPLVVGNWKMELSHKAAVALAGSIKDSVSTRKITAEVIVCPSYPSLPGVAEVMAHSAVAVGAQDIHWEEKGAWTGQVSVGQVSSFATACIVGHSERRMLLGETDATVAQKVTILFNHGLQPIVCIGETAEEKAADHTIAKVASQIESLIAVLPRTSLVRTVIAYEPIWAIGTGETPAPDEVAEIILLIRKMLAERFDGQLADRVRIIYGGSVKADTAGEYVGGPYADGVLVGGASVHAGQFLDIAETVSRIAQ